MPKTRIKQLIILPSAMQMVRREELVVVLAKYLDTCETPEDLAILNGNSAGLWVGDTRIIALLGAAGSRIYGGCQR